MEDEQPNQVNLGEDLLRVLGQMRLNPDARVDSYRVPKIAPFFRSDPTLWFTQVKTSFRRARITDQATMADCLITHLEGGVIAHMKDVITVSPPAADIYTRIKDRIISGFAESAETRLRRLLKGEVSFDGKPSVLLNRLRSYNDGGCTEEIMKTIFMDNLPKRVIAILAGNESADLHILARLADNIMAAVPTPPLSQLTSIAVSNEASTESLKTKVDWLVREMKKLKSKPPKPQPIRSRNKSRSHSKIRNPRNSSQNSDERKICFYHKKFGNKAKHCKGACPWTEKPDSEN